jgi:hypothetical protein
MFLELFDTHHVEEGATKKLGYATSLYREPTDFSLLSVKIPWANSLREGDLGEISLTLEHGRLAINRFYPFWEGIEKVGHMIQFSERPWRSDLLGRWIAACVEVLLLWQFAREDVLVHTDPFAGLSLLRLYQLRKYWIPEIIDIQSYLALLAVHFHSPQNHISKFPSWMSHSEVLQLSEKV